MFMQKALATKKAKDMLASLAFEPGGGSPQSFAAFIQTEISKWGQVIKSGGIRSE